MQLKLSSISTIHVKQQHTVGPFHFQVHCKYMVGNVYINKIHTRLCLYISLLWGRFFSFFQFLCYIQWNPSHLISKYLERIRFQLTNRSLVFNLIAI